MSFLQITQKNSLKSAFLVWFIYFSHANPPIPEQKENNSPPANLEKMIEKSS